MKKLLAPAFLAVILLCACSVYMVAEGIEIYDPAKDSSAGISAPIPDEEYTIEKMVMDADVIALVAFEDITHVKVIMEEKDALDKKGIFAFVRYIDVYYSWTVNESPGRDSNVYIDYTPKYENVTDPGFREDGEYIVFLKRISPDMPFVLHNFYDYYMMNDYRTYMLEANDENISKVRGLINALK